MPEQTEKPLSTPSHLVVRTTWRVSASSYQFLQEVRESFSPHASRHPEKKKIKIASCHEASRIIRKIRKISEFRRLKSSQREMFTSSWKWLPTWFEACLNWTSKVPTFLIAFSAVVETCVPFLDERSRKRGTLTGGFESVRETGLSIMQARSKYPGLAIWTSQDKML